MINLLNDNNVSSANDIDNTIDDETKQKIIEIQNYFNNRFYDIINNSNVSKENKDLLLNELNKELMVKITTIIYWNNINNYHLLMRFILDWLFNKYTTKKSE